MDYSKLIDEIVSRVSAYLEKESQEKKKLIVLTSDHGTVCHKVLECPVMTKHFRMECALMNNYDTAVDDCAGIVMFGLSNSELSRIVSGVCDTPFSDMVSKALLLGKKIWVPQEEVELLKYDKNTPYSEMMYEKLRILESFGVVITSYKALSDTILASSECNHTEISDGGCSSAPSCEDHVEEAICKEIRHTKKVITERDVANARLEGAGRILAGAKAILTDLAKEYADAYGIEIIKS